MYNIIYKSIITGRSRSRQNFTVDITHRNHALPTKFGDRRDINIISLYQLDNVGRRYRKSYKAQIQIY